MESSKRPDRPHVVPLNLGPEEARGDGVGPLTACDCDNYTCNCDHSTDVCVVAADSVCAAEEVPICGIWG